MGHPAVWRGFDATFAKGAKFRDGCCGWRWAVVGDVGVGGGSAVEF